ncbi:hypothetical protein MPSEU_000447000 [Mayamaea pseudoterrestris]|nr:hypothetical protein MPSEU_000447000 [Mayamaea pseudoterrestris]
MCDFALNTISAMRRQEQSYTKTPFLLEQQQDQAAPAVTSAQHVDIDCRTKMAAWCFQVIDFCRFRRETAEIAMNYLDRFSATPAGKQAREDRQVYQLAAMSCLYTAVKIHEPEAMNPLLVSNLSRGTYTPTQIEEMEAIILQALDWRVNPPTSLSFVRLLMDLESTQDLLPTQSMQRTVHDLSKYQAELAVNEYAFLTVQPSTIAYCSLMNAFESVGLDRFAIDKVGRVMADALGLDMSMAGCDATDLVTNWLYESVMRQNTTDVCMQPACVSSSTSKPSRRMSVDGSPRAVDGY